ncbi:MAG TPA: hypothetical protein VFT67_09020 [Jatrophihabitantaceae bacterium]|nr:hypothetical protein [Jatrophihabitantaceae bacterium]
MDAALLRDAQSAAGDGKAALAVAETYGGDIPLPGGGSTAARWQLFADLAAVDLTVARVVEAHTDALAILAEAGEGYCEGRWGVFAAEAPGVRLEARAEPDGEVRLYGTKPWCSLAGLLEHALVTAHVGDRRALFAVTLSGSAVRPEAPEGWIARGLSTVPSGPVHFDGAPARPVGGPDWYLLRPGFAWGGIGVAACWLGGARALAAAVRRQTARRADSVDAPILAMHLGGIDVALYAAGDCLAQAAVLVDAGSANGRDGELLALRVRSAVARAVEETLDRAAHVLGPGPLAFDEEYARRVADLQLYVRQHHGERDLATLGRMLAEAES